MVMVSKCCCCCSLKYGFLTFAVLSLIGRVCSAVSLFYIDSKLLVPHSTSLDYLVSVDALQKANVVSTGIGSLAGWYVITAALLAVALQGIFQKKAILLYPYIVVLVTELIVMVLVCIIIAIAFSAWVFVQMFIWGSINVYAVICMISLFHNIKDYEKSRPAIPYYDPRALKDIEQL